MHKNLVAKVVEFLSVFFDSVCLANCKDLAHEQVELVFAPIGFDCFVEILPVFQILLGLERFEPQKMS
jgi:hypothetical protein